MTQTSELQKIIQLPRLTERGTADQEKNNAYHFMVAPKANKVQIRQAVEKLFGVKVLSVNTLTRQGKTRRQYTKRGWKMWTDASWKKAVVKLKAGDTINFQ